ncbi:MAG TPA: hypothetical protein VF530_16540 [Planctomycetota bacterium]
MRKRRKNAARKTPHRACVLIATDLAPRSLTVVVVPVGRPRPDFNLVAPQPHGQKERRPLATLPRRARKDRVAADLSR